MLINIKHQMSLKSCKLQCQSLLTYFVLFCALKFVAVLSFSDILSKMGMWPFPLLPFFLPFCLFVTNFASVVDTGWHWLTLSNCCAFLPLDPWTWIHVSIWTNLRWKKRRINKRKIPRKYDFFPSRSFFFFHYCTPNALNFTSDR